MASPTAAAVSLMKDVATAFIIMTVTYIGFVFWLKAKVKDRKQFWLYKNLGSVAAVAILGIYLFWKFTHK